MNKLTTTNQKHVNVRCPYGFANQLRLALAGSFLVYSKCVESFTMEWIINNHNNVQFLDYFLPLPKLIFNKISTDVIAEDIYDTISFKRMIETYAKGAFSWEMALSASLKFCLPRPEISKMVQDFVTSNDINNTLGLHVRRTCKTSLLNSETHRNCSMLTNEEILRISELYDKIFLATDNKETQCWFKEQLGDKLLTYVDINEGEEYLKKEYDPNEVTRHTSGLHTVMDFLILKHCKTFLGSSESSFSLLVQHWRQNKEDFHIFGRL